MNYTRTRSTETTTHTIHIYHGTHYFSPVPALSRAALVEPVYVQSGGSGGIRTHKSRTRVSEARAQTTAPPRPHSWRGESRALIFKETENVIPTHSQRCSIVEWLCGRLSVNQIIQFGRCTFSKNKNIFHSLEAGNRAINSSFKPANSNFPRRLLSPLHQGPSTNSQPLFMAFYTLHFLIICRIPWQCQNLTCNAIMRRSQWVHRGGTFNIYMLDRPTFKHHYTIFFNAIFTVVDASTGNSACKVVRKLVENWNLGNSFTTVNANPCI